MKLRMFDLFEILTNRIYKLSLVCNNCGEFDREIFNKEIDEAIAILTEIKNTNRDE